MREQLAALAAFDPVFRDPAFRIEEQAGCEWKDEVLRPGPFRLGNVMNRFETMIFDYGWVRVIDRLAWHDTPAGQRMMDDPAVIAEATAEELAFIIAVGVNADLFCGGYFDSLIENGLIPATATRAARLLADMDRNAGPANKPG